ncbi:cytochrome b [Paracoccus sp. DMF]|uniref:cytochrome b n=1 Tax=unclassified Paracoccus (in: a-proteobacteria) TaxID=2688777 RepID=UPI001105501C|nr:cytochrome b/b6 domain-containing protein [Paracoccus sp. DMF]MCV2449495.1 cytochrome b/b6 domain-containing protein [Paracoccus sp. DMF]
MNIRREQETAYGRVSRLNHWTAAIAFMGALGLGLTMAYGSLDRETIGGLMDWHKALGVFVLAFGLWRVGWRIVHGFAAESADTPLWQRRVARVVHILLLTAIVLMPLSGILMTVAGGRALDVWNVTLVSSIGQIEWLDVLASQVHGLLGLFITAVLALHILAALKHVFDNVTKAGSLPGSQAVK